MPLSILDQAWGQLGGQKQQQNPFMFGGQQGQQPDPYGQQQQQPLGFGGGNSLPMQQQYQQPFQPLDFSQKPQQQFQDMPYDAGMPSDTGMPNSPFPTLGGSSGFVDPMGGGSTPGAQSAAQATDFMSHMGQPQTPPAGGGPVLGSLGPQDHTQWMAQGQPDSGGGSNAGFQLPEWMGGGSKTGGQWGWQELVDAGLQDPNAAEDRAGDHGGNSGGEGHDFSQ